MLVAGNWKTGTCHWQLSFTKIICETDEANNNNDFNLPAHWLKIAVMHDPMTVNLNFTKTALLPEW
jgi:hypothetical protein